MDRRSKKLLPLFIACAGLYLLWYKRVMIATDLDERIIFVLFCTLGFLITGLLLDSGRLRFDIRHVVLVLCGATIVCTLSALLLFPLRYPALALAGMSAGGNFLILVVIGMRALPYRYRGRAFAGVFFFAGFFNTLTDISELPWLQVSGSQANLVMASVSVLLCGGFILWKGGVLNLRILAIALDSEGGVRQILKIAGLAILSFFLLYMSLSAKESVAYPSAITEVSSSGFIRFIELPLWVIAGFVTDLFGRRVMLTSTLVAAFIGAAGTLAVSSPAITALTTLCTYFCLIGFPTTTCALLIDVGYYSRHPSLIGFFCFVPLALDQVFEGASLPFSNGLTNDVLFIVDVVILALFAVASTWLFSLIGANIAILKTEVDVMELEERDIKGIVSEQSSLIFPFTRREQEVLALVIEGLTVRQMAQRLVISESTVKFHITNMLKKTAAENRTQMLERLKS
jgi:DNA-binding CsgD family transcriptional regulator